MKRVIWSPTARRSLRQTSYFIAKVWNVQLRDEFLIQLNYRITQIQKNPELAPPFENIQIRKLVVHETISLFYQNSSDHIRLLLIWDNRQNPAELYRKLTDANNS